VEQPSQPASQPASRPDPSSFSPRVLAAGATDKGKVREKNEDHFAIAQLTRAMYIRASSLNQPPALLGEVVRGSLFVVADGMGGHNAGEHASALAVVTIEDFLLNTLSWFFRLQGDNLVAEFQQALRAADDRIYAESQRRPGMRGMGTTVTLAYALDDILYVAHAGDSRLYIARGGTLYQVTSDHTLVNELVQNRVIPPEAARTHPMRNIITNTLGGDRPGVRPEIHKIKLEPGDAVLLCSDGLTEHVRDEEIGQLIAAEEDPAAVCNRLVARANELGGSDNITAVLARFLP
jgi:PPM family protein phosphatase